MLNALKKLFGIKAAEKVAPAPYKVEAAPAAAKPAVKKPAAKKPAAKPAKPRKPKGNI